MTSVCPLQKAVSLSAKSTHSSKDISNKIRCAPSWVETTISPELTRQTESPAETDFGLRIETVSMFSLKDILDLLDHWPKWKRIQEMPEQFDGLQKRIAELEGRLARCPSEGCPKCGELAFRVSSSRPHPEIGDMGVTLRMMTCDKCGFSEETMISPKKR
jgi:predicted RNA-binding Zn-ribbon protein involved in translation (DUF1610 family)